MAVVGSLSFALNDYIVHFLHFNMETETVDDAGRKK